MAVGAGVENAPAQSQSQTADYGSASAPIQIGAGGFPVNLMFSKFDGSLGTNGRPVHELWGRAQTWGSDMG